MNSILNLNTPPPGLSSVTESIVLADSSTQHSEEFEHVAVLSVELECIVDLAACADELSVMWTQLNYNM